MQNNSLIIYTLISYRSLKINQKSVIHKKTLAAITAVIITIILYLQEL